MRVHCQGVGSSSAFGTGRGDTHQSGHLSGEKRDLLCQGLDVLRVVLSIKELIVRSTWLRSAPWPARACCGVARSIWLDDSVVRKGVLNPGAKDKTAFRNRNQTFIG